MTRIPRMTGDGFRIVRLIHIIRANPNAHTTLCGVWHETFRRSCKDHAKLPNVLRKSFTKYVVRR